MPTPPLSDEQWDETLRAYSECKGNISAAARQLGIARSSMQARLATGRAKGLIPDGPTLEGLALKGTSTLYGADGEVRATWIKTHVDSEKQEQMVRETIAALVRDITPAKPLPAPKQTTSDILSAYCIGDAHLGLYSWGAETGEDFDIEIAQRDLKAAADRLIASTPASDNALIVQLGDFYHADDSRNVTPKSGNQLDTDSRFPKVIRAGINTMRYLIDRAREKHKNVIVRNVAGNHDPHAYITLNEALLGYYDREPRVEIADSPRPFFTYRFGSNLIGITHGHGARAEKLPGILAVDAQKDWGDCDFRYVWHGHIHSKRVFEDMGVIVESFRTLAGKDAWHTESGYRSGREMQAIVLHRDFGEIERHTAGLRRIRSEDVPQERRRQRNLNPSGRDRHRDGVDANG